MSEWIIILLLIILLPAAVFDYRYHKIPNIISLSGWVLGPLLYLLIDTLPGVLSSLYGFLLVFALTLPFYILRWMGAGDVKLMASVGAIVGVEYAPEVLFGIVMTGAVMGAIMLLYKKLFKVSFQRYEAILGLSLASKKPIYMDPNEDEQKIVIPYAIPIAIGTFLSIGFFYINM